MICQGRDYDHIDELLEELREYNEDAERSGGLVIASGMARYEDDSCLGTVFQRADHNMYENKNALNAASEMKGER